MELYQALLIALSIGFGVLIGMRPIGGFNLRFRAMDALDTLDDLFEKLEPKLVRKENSAVYRWMEILTCTVLALWATIYGLVNLVSFIAAF